MFRFFRNLFNIGKKKDYMDVKIDKAHGIMTITTDKELSPKEIMDILREHLGDE